ncbi:cyclic nucleotide-binding protein [Yokenella regensburgei ATCC 49455]|uniref:Fumarate and nitrate reduction regulatory protein n=2 Tax=Yokenella regensburgei TaxID=158877 RepID=A0AB38G3Q0_9ENTR|nr:cyclic nucleotide-binding protein [Yokenella regensburgei ATCC 49455]SQA65312.1 Fumarate and nitrate reduction regulatory protein [Yokenella regensburgei]SQA95763.1 Fumarate and nitrate reduction regulatory protein [Yokenella regensburgei]SUQ03888.1 Fumarate and nitrate reduction regulatory protein [Yokenella regensburgei]
MFRSPLRDIIRQRPSLQYGKKKHLWRAGDKRSGLWLIKFGAVKTFYLNTSGEVHITGFYLPGEYIGVDELPGELHQGYAQVIDDCAVHNLPPTQLSEFMGTSDGRQYVYQMISEHLRLNKARFHQLRHMSAGEKLAHFIYDLAVRYGYPGYIRREFRLPVLRCDIANYIGVTPETVAREIVRLVAAGAFRFSGRNISALRPSVLVQLAGGTLPNQNDEQSLTEIRRAGYGQ